MKTGCPDETLHTQTALLPAFVPAPVREPTLRPLALADYHDVYDVANIERAQREETARADALKALHAKMKRLGGQRYLIKPSSLAKLDALYAHSPNFKPVIDDIKKQTALALAGSEPVSFTPMLLLGDPGLGKTHFAKSVAKILGVSFEFISMSSLTAGWILSGASSQWNNARPGKVAEALIHGAYANPLIALDEIDKAGGDARYDPMGALYNLLERETAAQFRDEFVDIDIDASQVLWIATANDESSLPEPILNRMNVYAIEPPDCAGAMKIAHAIYTDILSQHRWGFLPEPGTDVLEKLALISPRDMRKTLIDAFGNARLAGHDYLAADDVRIEKRRPAKKARIGF